jgi:rubrerythrin
MPFNLSDIDVDGAIEETASHVDGDTRAAFLRKAGVAGGATLSAGAFMSMLPEMASAAPSKKQDLQILNFALTLEFLEAAFYKKATASGALSGMVQDLAVKLNIDEQTHVKTLRSVIKSLGGKPVKEPTFDFKGTTDDQTKFIATSFVLENTGVHAYLGQAGRLKSKTLLGAAASILTVEARHAGAIAVILNSNPFGTTKETRKMSISPNGSFDTPRTKAQILSAVKKTGFIPALGK